MANLRTSCRGKNIKTITSLKTNFEFLKEHFNRPEKYQRLYVHKNKPLPNILRNCQNILRYSSKICIIYIYIYTYIYIERERENGLETMNKNLLANLLIRVASMLFWKH